MVVYAAYQRINYMDYGTLVEHVFVIPLDLNSCV